MSATGRHSANGRGFPSYRDQPRLAVAAQPGHPPARRWRMRWGAAAAASVLALGALDARLASEIMGCPSWVPQVSPQCAPPTPRYAIEDYLTTTHSSAPVKNNEHGDLHGMGEGATPSEITRAFPPGTSHLVDALNAQRHRES